jgi:hypothetical protein
MRLQQRRGSKEGGYADVNFHGKKLPTFGYMELWLLSETVVG